MSALLCQEASTLTPTPFSIDLSFKGTSTPLENLTTATTNFQLHSLATALLNQTNSSLKLIFKGKQIDPSSNDTTFKVVPRKTSKVMVLATPMKTISDTNNLKSDPTIRGFTNTRAAPTNVTVSEWGESYKVQNKKHKFCKFNACTEHSFGTRSNSTTPHAFHASNLLTKLATDPGILKIMNERELVVGTLGEMDPVDDRIMLKMQSNNKGCCLLGYNTNSGARIDLKLRTDDLKTFLPYGDIVKTLIHELSHNWVGEHNYTFWTNYGHMRAEYLHTHRVLRGDLVNGKTTASIAGVSGVLVVDVYRFLMVELAGEMRQHGLDVAVIGEMVRERCVELEGLVEGGKSSGGGGGGRGGDEGGSGREMALKAAEKRQNEQQNRQQNEEKK